MTLYQEIRAAGKQMTGKITDAMRHPEFDMIRTAKRVGLPTVGKTLIFGGEVDQEYQDVI